MTAKRTTTKTKRTPRRKAIKSLGTIHTYSGESGKLSEAEETKTTPHSKPQTSGAGSADGGNCAPQLDLQTPPASQECPQPTAASRVRDAQAGSADSKENPDVGSLAAQRARSHAVAVELTDAIAPKKKAAPKQIQFRPYQKGIFMDRLSGILILHWSRQIGKSFTLASWAVDRLLSKLPENDSWLVTVLSNSRDNGAEFVVKCQEVCNKVGAAMETFDDSPDLRYENMRMEVRITTMVGGRERIGRIKVLAANPRTARGFSGDLILDEFAFHEDSMAIWEAAEPIISSNQEFQCRIASTGNGKRNMFYRMASGPGPYDGTPFMSPAGFRVSRVARSAAVLQGVKVFDPATSQPITPAQARERALDKGAYDQNYECMFADENMVLLTHELISAAERALITIDSQAWSATSLARMARCEGELYFGNDVARTRDLSVLTVINKIGRTKRVVGMLRMSGMRLPDQQRQLDLVCALPNFRKGCGDMTGLGLGLVEYAQDKWGTWRIIGVNFSSTVPLSNRLLQEGRKQETARITEVMALDLLGAFEDRSLEIPADQELRDDLRKPERVTSEGGRVSIAAARDAAGHADHFWSLALAVKACGEASGPVEFTAVKQRNREDERPRGHIRRERGQIL